MDVLSRCACGGAPALYAPDVKSETKYAASVVCHHCGVSMQMANHDSDPKRVVAAWNRAHPHRINTMTVNEKGLEPCPFCGGPAELDNAAEPQFARRPTVTCANEDCFGYMPSAYFATDKEAIAAWNRRASIVGAEPVLANVLGDENDLHSVSHALDIGGIGTPYRAYQGSLYCDYQPHRIADFQDYGLALAASVLFNSAKAIKAALAHPAPSAGEGGVRVKGLEWEATPDEMGRNGWRFRGTPAVGLSYIVTVTVHGQRGELWELANIGLFDTLDEAKAAAQADYERRIRSSLQ